MNIAAHIEKIAIDAKSEIFKIVSICDPLTASGKTAEDTIIPTAEMIKNMIRQLSNAGQPLNLAT